MAAAEAIWKRSVMTTKMRYTTLLSDGDAKTFKHLCDLHVYGPDCAIMKEECINHIAKCLGTGLKKHCEGMEGQRSDYRRKKGRPFEGRNNSEAAEFL